MEKTVTTTLFNTIFEIEKKILEKKQEQIQELGRDKMTDRTKDFLTKKTVWSHKRNKSFKFIHYPQTIEQCSLKTFVENLMDSYNTYLASKGKEPFLDNMKAV